MQNEWSWIHFRKFCNGIEWLLILMYFLCIGPIDITFDPPNYIFSILHWNFTSQNRWKIWPTMRSFIMFSMCSTYSMSHESVRRVTVWDIPFPRLLCTFTFIRGLSIVKFYLSRIALEFYKPKPTKNLGQKRGHRYLFGIFATTLHL